MILFLVIFCLTLNGGLGAPTTAVYKFVKCNPEGGQANCITHQSADMEWSPELPTKLPAAAAQYLEAEPVEDEKPEVEEGVEEEEEESPMMSEEGESPPVYLPEEGSGVYEGSGFMADYATGAADTGSGEDLKPYKGGRGSRKGTWFTKLPNEQKPAEQELKEDHLLLQN